MDAANAAVAPAKEAGVYLLASGETESDWKRGQVDFAVHILHPTHSTKTTTDSACAASAYPTVGWLLQLPWQNHPSPDTTPIVVYVGIKHSFCAEAHGYGWTGADFSCHFSAPAGFIDKDQYIQILVKITATEVKPLSGR